MRGSANILELSCLHRQPCSLLLTTSYNSIALSWLSDTNRQAPVHVVRPSPDHADRPLLHGTMPMPPTHSHNFFSSKPQKAVSEDRVSCIPRFYVALDCFSGRDVPPWGERWATFFFLGITRRFPCGAIWENNLLPRWPRRWNASAAV